MTEEQESKPLTRGLLNASAMVPEKEKLSFPVGKMIKAHVGADGRIVVQPKVYKNEDGTETEKMQTKVLFTFTIDDDVADTETKNSLKGKSFTKGILISKSAKAKYSGFITAVNGDYSDDPFDAMGKPLQLLFGAWDVFDGHDYQPITYLPPADGQMAPEKDVVIEPGTDLEEVMSEFDKATGK